MLDNIKNWYKNSTNKGIIKIIIFIAIALVLMFVTTILSSNTNQREQVINKDEDRSFADITEL